MVLFGSILMSEKLDALLKSLEEVKNPKEKVVVIHSAFDEKPHTVAFVDCPKTMTTDEKLEFVFMKTNSIDDAWWNNEDVTPMFDGEGCRSTSVGDMVLVGTEKFVCENTGWSKV